MKIEKSYELSVNVELEVDRVIAVGRSEYADLLHIVWESSIDASLYFEEDFLE